MKPDAPGAFAETSPGQCLTRRRTGCPLRGGVARERDDRLLAEAVGPVQELRLRKV